MIKKIVTLFLLIFTLTSCAEERSRKDTNGIFLASARSEGQDIEYLSYEHFITIDVKEEILSNSYENTINECLNDREYNSTILDSRISRGDYPSAFIRLRIKPEGVKAILLFVSRMGKVVQESTHVEDLAKPILDNKQRLKMLETHRDKLLLLQEKASDDIEALIKIASELSEIQSELEKAMGQNEYLSQRVNLDIVNIQFQVKMSRSFWKPISDSLSNFLNNLSDGISGTIAAVAYLLPGICLFIFAFFIVRFFWKKRKTK